MKLLLLLGLSLSATILSAQEKIIRKNGNQIEVKIIEVAKWKVTYKKSDNPDGPTHSIDKSDIYKIVYSNDKSDILGKFSNAEEAKALIVSKINEFGIDRYNNFQKLKAEFDGNNLKINSVNKKGKTVDEGDFWDFENVIKFHELSPRKDVYYLNIVTKRFKKSSSEVDKLVIKFTDWQAAEDVLVAMKDLQIILKKD